MVWSSEKGPGSRNRNKPPSDTVRTFPLFLYIIDTNSTLLNDTDARKYSSKSVIQPDN